MKTRKKLAALCMILVLGLSCLVYGNSIHSYAASTQFSISLSSSSIQKGGSVTVTVSISCSEALGAYSYCLSYDSSLLEYQSGDGYGGGGTVSCAGYGDGNITSASNSFTFSAINTGSAYVSTGSSDVYTWGEEHAGASDAGATITITAAGGNSTTEATTSEPNTTDTPATTETNSSESTTEDTTDTSSEDTTEDTTEEMSDNCYLSSIQITPGELKPEFAKDTYTYETTVPGDTTSLAINAIPEDSKSSVSITGNEDFEPGKTSHISIKVTAETGDNHIYDIAVNVEELVDTRAIIQIDGKDYYFTEDYSKLTIPEGFAEIKEKYNDTEIILYQSPNGLVKCAYLTDKDSKNGAWYIIDTTAKSAVPFINVASAYKSFIILTAGEDVTVPSGYTAFTYKFNKNSVTAYHKYEDDTILVVYAMSPDGEPGWFYYDTVEKTFTRFVAEAVPTEAVTTASATDTDNGSFFDQHKDKVITICIIVIVVMFFLIIILGIMLIRVIKHGLPDDDPDDDDPDNDPDGDASNNLDNNTADNAGNDSDNASNSAADDTPDNTDHNTGNDTGIDTDNTSDDTASANDTKSEDTIAAAVVLNETPAENADDTNNQNAEDQKAAEQNAAESDAIDQNTAEQNVTNPKPEKVITEEINSQKPADIPVTDGMTELTAKPSVKAEDVTSTRLSSEAKKAKEEKEATPANEIIKKAAQYSSMNTADLSEVFNMAEAIVNHEEPKKNTGSLQFKPIKQNVPDSKEEK